MTRPPFRLSPRPDEMLYSILARLSHRLGSPARAEFQEVLLGADLSIYDDMPVGLDALVAGGWLEMTQDEALHRLTLFPYYASFVVSRRRAAARAAVSGRGPWPHQVLGSWHTDVPAPDRLRFCAACRSEMLEREADAWWRRVHQLPSVIVCPDHGEVLLQSTLSRRQRRKGYARASDDLCRTTAGPVTPMPDRREAEELLWLARVSQLLLEQADDGLCGAIVASHGQGLVRLGLDDEVASDLKAATALVIKRWGTVLERWPGPARPRLRKAVGAALRSEPVPPLIHLLLLGALRPPGTDPLEFSIVSNRLSVTWVSCFGRH